MLSGGECNGFLYACIGTDDNPDNNDGGVFWRQDGLHAQWHLIHEFEGNPEDFQEDVRGFTAVPHPNGVGLRCRTSGTQQSEHDRAHPPNRYR